MHFKFYFLHPFFKLRNVLFFITIPQIHSPIPCDSYTPVLPFCQPHSEKKIKKIPDQQNWPRMWRSLCYTVFEGGAIGKPEREQGEELQEPIRQATLWTRDAAKPATFRWSTSLSTVWKPPAQCRADECPARYWGCWTLRRCTVDSRGMCGDYFASQLFFRETRNERNWRCIPLAAQRKPTCGGLQTDTTPVPPKDAPDANAKLIDTQASFSPALTLPDAAAGYNPPDEAEQQAEWGSDSPLRIKKYIPSGFVRSTPSRCCSSFQPHKPGLCGLWRWAMMRRDRHALSAVSPLADRSKAFRIQ